MQTPPLYTDYAVPIKLLRYLQAMSLSIRAFTPDDLPSVLSIYKGLRPAGIEPPSLEETPRMQWVAVVDDQVVGYANCHSQSGGGFTTLIAPAIQRRGVGNRLLTELEAEASKAGIDALQPWVREENESGIQWLLANGFRRIQEDGPVSLYPQEADLSAFADSEVRLASEGIVIHALEDLSELCPTVTELLFELANEIHDRPSPSPDEKAEFKRKHRESDLMRDAYFVARHDDRLVGLSHLGPREPDVNVDEPGIIQQCLTGVLPLYRCRGIALALKLRTIAYCRAHGYRRLLTHSSNPAMIALNRKLNFISGPWRVFYKELPNILTGD